ncbi:MAG: tRNA (adenosine(37)-N6)-threonylcarbamoyltransferase complex dimerization subunit type 1 TsaB [Acidobacteriota bacterium]
MNLTLSIDTSSHNSSISVLEEENILTEYNFTSSKDLSATLIPNIDFILKNLGLTISEIDIFGIASGPGFFTGIRVGISTLKGLLFGKNIPIVPVTALEALAYKTGPEFSEITPLIDARRSEVYTATYNFRKKDKIERTLPLLTPISDLKDVLKKTKEFVFTGSGSEAHTDYLTENFKNCLIIKKSPYLSSEIGKIALNEYKKGHFITDISELSPLYIRRPDAEKNLRSD